MTPINFKNSEMAGHLPDNSLITEKKSISSTLCDKLHQNKRILLIGSAVLLGGLAVLGGTYAYGFFGKIDPSSVVRLVDDINIPQIKPIPETAKAVDTIIHDNVFPAIRMTVILFLSSIAFLEYSQPYRRPQTMI